MRRLLLWFLLVSLLLTASATALLIGTEQGLKTLSALASSLSGGRVRVGSTSGTLLGTLQLNDLRYEDGADRVGIEHLALRWQPRELFGNGVHIESVTAAGVRVALGPSDNDEPLVLPDLSLPLPLHIG
ncbi:MAG: hypothetical protein RBT36_08300, partial [Desulfobulbus sp.]|nr:hypothetical protein [Desulfobulbus sp.]